MAQVFSVLGQKRATAGGVKKHGKESIPLAVFFGILFFRLT